MSRKPSVPTVTVEMMMTSEVKCLSTTMTLREAVILLLTNRISGAPVVDHLQQVVSVVSETDLLKLAGLGMNTTIGQCLSSLARAPQLITLQRHNTFEQAYKIFMTKPIHRIIVVDSNNRIQGVLTRGNVLRILVDLKRDRKSRSA